MQEAIQEKPPNKPPLSLPFPWVQGQHLMMVGDTGTGKSLLASRLIQTFQHTIVLRSKADDIRYPGKLIRKAAAISDPRFDRFILDPKYEEQYDEFYKAFRLIWTQKHWLVYLDELFGITRLGLTKPIEQLLTQGRSMGITVVGGLQRPVSVTRFALSQARHVISFGQEGRDIKLVAEATSPRMGESIATLSQHQFAWYYRPTREIFIGRLQDLEGET